MSIPRKSRPILHVNRGKIVAPAEPRKAAAPPGAAATATCRAEMIAVAAYYRAENRHFSPGGELDDWLAAEREFDAAQAGAGISATSS